jgi:hypothetical protein
LGISGDTAALLASTAAPAFGDRGDCHYRPKAAQRVLEFCERFEGGGGARACWERGVSKSVVLLTGDRGFESGFLQQRDGMGQATRRWHHRRCG